MQQDYNLTAAYVQAVTNQSYDTAIVDFRLIHDVDKTVPAHHYTGTLPQLWSTIVDYQSRGYGAFMNVNALDGHGRLLENVAYIRAHIVDLDNINAQANYARALDWQPQPTFAVNSSPGKFHVYWVVAPYRDNDYYTTLQRKLRQVFDGDKQVIDPTRVVRLPGTLHLKEPSQPHLVTCHAVSGQMVDIGALNASVAHVNIIDSAGGRHDLGDPELAAPSLDWLRFGLSMIDPNTLDRGEWISVTAAVKQSGWTLGDEQTIRDIWDNWCARYAGNDIGENDKQWRSIRDTEIGWSSIQRRVPTLKAYEQFGFKEPPPVSVQQQQLLPPVSQPTLPTSDEQFSEILSPQECARYFKGCYFITRFGKILSPDGRFLNATQFNGKFGGHLFVVTPDGKTTDEPWKAALRSTEFTIPKVDHIRFLPDKPSMSIVTDDIGRSGINTFIPIIPRARHGDVSPWLQHMSFILPDEKDRCILFDYLAHNVKYPGYKIPWAPMIQSVEGVGKGFIRETLAFALGQTYVYSPKAPELVKSGSTFNAWMRSKLMIIVDEIKIDERRELIEILKPMITDTPIEIQAKGVDQELEDNPANWLFFSNYKDAIPISQNSRRYAIFYSALQSVEDIMRCFNPDIYFPALFDWLRNQGGHEFINQWFLDYPIERGGVPSRAPVTSSQPEVIRVSRGPIEVAIENAVSDHAAGFRGGYVSVLAVIARLRQIGVRAPTQSTVCRILEQLGYHELGRATRQYGQESMTDRTTVYAIMKELPIEAFGRIQGYE